MVAFLMRKPPSLDVRRSELPVAPRPGRSGKITGTSQPAERIRRSASNPTRSGSITSSRTRAGRDDCTACTALAPLAAVTTSNPARRSDPDSSSEMVASSSRTRSVRHLAPTRSGRSPGARAPPSRQHRRSNRMSSLTVIGLRAMGRPLARNLLAAGHQVTVWNRSSQPVADLVAEGGRPAPSVREALQTGTVLSMLSNDDAVTETFLDSGVLPVAPAGTVHVNLATVSTALARRAAEAHAAHGVGYVTAPVFGRVPMAETGTLTSPPRGTRRSSTGCGHCSTSSAHAPGGWATGPSRRTSSRSSATTWPPPSSSPSVKRQPRRARRRRRCATHRTAHQ
jgi:hypothetical protein